MYRQSKVLLSDYLRYLKEAKNMVEDRPDTMVMLDPETAKPFYLEKNDPRIKQVKVDGQWVEYNGIGCGCYNAEVIVEKTCIPPRKLKIINDKICRGPCSTPVVNKVDYFKK